MYRYSKSRIGDPAALESKVLRRVEYLEVWKASQKAPAS